MSRRRAVVALTLGLLVVIAAALAAVSDYLELLGALLLLALGVLLVAMVVSVPVGYRAARGQGRSRSASVWRAVTAPFRFVLAWF